ncbi:unnamed protein product [Orchesella dallaii]|uniref:Uncharacterized protein n=1 Tax=Orchesella dallaii TaxID=48710 RepID=A0ABP1R168_9HEXA
MGRYHQCTEYCFNPTGCNARSGCYYDYSISHCVQDSFKPPPPPSPLPPASTPPPPPPTPTQPPTTTESPRVACTSNKLTLIIVLQFYFPYLCMV